MRWEFSRRSTNVEDRRGSSVSAPVVGGGIGAVVLALIVAFLGGDPSIVFQQSHPSSDRPDSESSQTTKAPAKDQMAQFVSVVLADTEDTWHDWFRQRGQTYVEPTLVLYSNAVESACGDARSAVGPFYCPRDQKVYIDLLLWQWQED